MNFNEIKSKSRNLYVNYFKDNFFEFWENFKRFFSYIGTKSEKYRNTLTLQ